MRIELIKNYYQSDEYLKKLRVRANNLEDLGSELQRLKLLTDVYSVNPQSFIETFGWIPIKEIGQVKPFFLWEYQKNILWKIYESEVDDREHEILIDKPREMGLTWLFVWYLVWRWIFKPNWSAFVLSRTEAEVDDGTANPDGSLFGKIRWAIRMLPDFVVPPGYIPKETSKGTGTDMKLKIINPNMDSIIVGSPSSSGSGRSRRYNFVFVDECFAIENFLDIWKSLQSVSKMKVFVSTTKADIRFQRFKEVCEKNGDYISLTWRDNPFRDEIWFNEIKEKAEIDPDVLKEFEPSYTPSEKYQYYPQIRESKIEHLNFNPKLPLYCGFDWGQNDLCVIIWFQFDGKRILVLDSFSYRGRSPMFYIPFLNVEKDYAPDWYQVDYVKEFLNFVRSWRVSPKAVFGEAAHRQRNIFIEGDPRLYSIYDIFRSNGIRFIVNNNAITHLVRHSATSKLLPICVFNSERDGSMRVYNAIANSRYAQPMARATSKESYLKPLHQTEIADFRSAFENFCVNFNLITRAERGNFPEGYDSVISSIYRSFSKIEKRNND